MDSLQQSYQAHQAQGAESREKKTMELAQKAAPEQAGERKKLRAPRSRKYIKAINQTIPLQETGQEMKEAVQMLPVTNELLGILAPCAIPGCIIHSIDKEGDIIQHYRSLEEMAPDLREGYEIWLEHRDCTCIEVYTHTTCIIYDDGTVKFVERKQ